MSTWTPRKKRANRYPKITNYAAFGLMLIAIILIAVHYSGAVIGTIKSDISSTRNQTTARAGAIKPKAATIDSIFARTFADLGLQQIHLDKVTSDTLGRIFAYPTYRALWPQAYPFVWFTIKLQANCHRYDSLFYDAVELKGGKNLAAILINSKETLGRIDLSASDKPVAPAFSMAFIFNDFSCLRGEQIQKLNKFQIPYGYVLKAEQSPDKILAAILRSGKGQCILEIPTDLESWKIILRGKLHSKPGKDISFDQKSISAVIGQFPHLSAFYLNCKGGIDKELAKLLIAELGRRELLFLYTDIAPNYIDSLAYANGLNIAQFSVRNDCRGQSDDKCRDAILAKSNVLNADDKGVFFLDSNPSNINMLSSLKNVLDKLNIAIVSPPAKTKLIYKL